MNDRESPNADAPVIGAETDADTALAALTFIASVVPVVGALAGAGIAELRRAFDRRQAERLAAVVDELRGALVALASRIERDLGSDGQFALFLEAALESAATARNDEKRRFYVALMARAATVDGPERLQRTLFLDTLDRLRYPHLALLQAVAAGPKPERMGDYHTPGTECYQAIHLSMPDMDDVFLYRAWDDMVALGLLASLTDYIVTEESPMEERGEPLTRYGRAFERFVAPFPEPGPTTSTK
jgi:hypothetical protein